MLYEFHNTGEILQLSNFWDSPECKEGRMYLTWNADVGRLLVPDSTKIELFPEIKNTDLVEIKELEDRICLYFHDPKNEGNPYLVQIEKGMTDRSALRKGNTRIDVYVELGIKYQFKAEIV